MTLVVVGALVGFPFALVIAWVFEITPEGVAKTDQLDAVHPERVEAGGGVGGAGNRRLATAVGAALLLLAAAWFAVGRAIVPDEVALRETSLAVFPFAVNGPEEFGYLREGLVTLLSRNLSGFGDLQAVDPSAIVKAAEKGGQLDRNAGGEIARSVGAGRFVMGSVNAAGGEVRILASLYALKDSIDALASGEVTGSSEDILHLVDELTARLLADQKTGAASDRMIRSAALMTTSLEALKAYLEGEQHFRVGEQREAQDAFQRALTADSLFAIARYRLAVSRGFTHNHDLARREVVRALAQAERLGEHDVQVLEAMRTQLDGDVDEAERLFRGAIQRYPRDLEAKVLLAELLTEYFDLRGDSPAEARRLYEDVLEADPGFTCVYCALEYIAVVEGDGRAFRDYIRRSHEADGEDPELHPNQELIARARVEGNRDSTLAYLPQRLADAAGRENEAHLLQHDIPLELFSVGAFDTARALMDEGYAKDPDANLRAEMLKHEYLAIGRWAEADRQLRTLFELTDPDEYPDLPDEALLEAPLEAALPVLSVVRERLLAWTEGRAESFPEDEGWPERLRPVSRAYLLGLVESRMGNPDAAMAWADTLSGFGAETEPELRLVSAVQATIRADVALREGQPERVLAEVEPLRPNIPPAWIFSTLAPYSYARSLQARALLDLGRYEQAHRLLRFSVKGEFLEPGMYGLWHRDMARALEGLQRYDEARAHYAAFLDAWKDADPELQPLVESARSRFQAIQEASNPND